MSRHHQELKEAGVTLDCLFAHAPRNESGQPMGHAIKHAGYPAAGKIRIVSLKDRVAGRADAELLLDGDSWRDWTASQKAALIDHELQHLSVLVSASGAAKTDDCGRPKIKIRLHDYQFGGFKAIAERHGDDSFEVSEMRHVVDRFGQVLMPWMELEGVGR
jgi:hypothetical protein